MAPGAIIQTLLALAALAVSPAAASCAHGTFLMPREEGEVKVSTFSYAGATGPLNWASLEEANALCASGTRQSPIDMTGDVFTTVPASSVGLTIPDMPSGAEFENLGTTVEVVVPEDRAGNLTLRDTVFTMKQFHFHLPAEHLDDGHSHAMEMHMVFQSEAEEIAVVGTYIVVADCAAPAKMKPRCRPAAKERRQEAAAGTAPTAPSWLLETIFGSVGEIAEPGSATTTRPLDMSEVLGVITSGDFQTYSGSLTTPPCSEGVNWMVATQKLGVKASTFETVRNVLSFNSRFTQNAPGQPNAIMVALGSLSQ